MKPPEPGQHASDEERSLAVALAYKPGSAAPRVVAKGRGLIADEIVRRAHEHGVFVHESPELVTLLLQVDLDASIPPQLYVVIAELLVWLYRLEGGEALAGAAIESPGILSKGNID